MMRPCAVRGPEERPWRGYIDFEDILLGGAGGNPISQRVVSFFDEYKYDKMGFRCSLEAENADRTTLYKEIAKANDFGNDRVGNIQCIFVDAWIDRAEKGWWIQRPDETWKKR